VSKYLSSSSFDFSGKSVLIRIDSDVDLREDSGQLVVDEPFRLNQVLPTLKFLEKAGVEKIIMIGHLGRPAGNLDKDLSLAPVADWFTENYKDCFFIPDYQLPVTNYFFLLDNLRFHPGERANKPEFVKKLASLADVYVNEAFGSSHRDHASITGIPQYLPSFLGFNFEEEIKNLTKIKKTAERPLIIVLGGSKKGKIDYVPFLADLADTLLIGGKLPLILKRKYLQGGVAPAAHLGGENSDKSADNELVLAELKPNGRDISRKSTEKFKSVINQAASVFMVGPLGVYEETENRQGTVEVAQAIAKSDAFKLAAGGDTHRVLSLLNLWGKFDFVSTGGGAALQFLRDETLPGIEIISNS